MKNVIHGKGVTFDDWFGDRFPEYVLNGEPIEPYYSVARIAYEEGFEDGLCDREKV